MGLQSKFPTFGNLVHRDEQMRKENVYVTGLSGYGQDVDPNEIRAWKKLPNISEFRIDLRPYDWVFALFGITKRVQPKLEFTSWKNAPQNRYVDYMFKRLRRQVELKLYDEAVTTMWILMNSTSYLACAINKVAHNWHRNESLFIVDDLIKEIKWLIQTKAYAMDFHRYYLEEPKKIRPLGVPKLSWRIYLHMYNNLIVEWRAISEKGKQHAYLPGKGTITAWEAVVNLLDRPNLVEADLKGFFNGVTHKGINSELRKMGMPEHEIKWINKLNQSVVKLPSDLKIPESVDVVHLNTRLNKGYKVNSWTNKQEGEVTIVTEKGKEIKVLLPSLEFFAKDIVDLDNVNQEFFYESKEDLNSTLGLALSDYDDTLFLSKELEVGVPQGAPTSCSFSTLALRHLEDRNVVIYSDDFIDSPDSSNLDLNSYSSEEYGIEIKPEGTKWLKKDGKWQVDSFKFLGIRYYPPKSRVEFVENYEMKYQLGWNLKEWIKYIKERCVRIMNNEPVTPLRKVFEHCLLKIPERFEADTRNGAKLTFTRRESFIAYLYNAREMLVASGSAGNSFFYKRPLSDWLVHEFKKFNLLKNAPRLLFTKVKGKKFPIKPLTGWFFSRMYSNAWNLEMKQRFQLSYKKDSWMGYRWGAYCIEHGLDYEDITVFTASSFACHDLCNMIDNPLTYKEFKANNFRKIYINRRDNERYWADLSKRLNNQ